MPFPKKNTNRSRRTSSRISSALLIEATASPSKSSYRRCSSKGLLCFSLRDNRCSECIRFGVESKCNAEMSNRTVKALKEQEAALEKAQIEVLEASAKVVR